MKMFNVNNKTKLYVVAGFAVGFYVGRNWDIGIHVNFNKKGVK